MALKTEARKPLYAVVGASDAAVENIKELPAQVVVQVAMLPSLVKGLRGGVESTTTALAGKAFGSYGDLVERGEELVRSIRRGTATERTQAQIEVANAPATGAKTTSAAKAAKTTAKATAKTVGSAADRIG